MTVVCGVDLSPLSRTTVEAAAAFAAALGEPLVLAHALGDAAYLFDAAVVRELREKASQRLEGIAVELAPPDVRDRVRIEVLDGGAHRGLVALAKREGATLLVVGSHGHGGRTRLGLGSTAERCALHSLTPVLVAHDAAPFVRWAEGRHALQVVVCVEPFRETTPGLSWICRLRAAAPCDVTVASAYYPDVLEERWREPFPPSLVEPDARLERHLLERLQATIGELPGMGRFTIRLKLALTRVAEPLVELATSAGAELMVVGSHHRHGPPRPWSVSAGVIHLSPVSVAAIPDVGGLPAS